MSRKLPVKKMMTEYFARQLQRGHDIYANHELGLMAHYLDYRYGRFVNIGTLERKWRELKHDGIIKAVDVTPPRNREKVWQIIEVNVL